ncbi:MAG: SDR family oxidoreductase [Gemmatimonadota bacterium]|nr:MAG: SDR family oxidoreductase [Gemmatimonadota bacterium]
MIDLGLKGKVAVVTGGNNPHGIGSVTVKAFASQGVKVFIHYFRQKVASPRDMNTTDDLDKPGLLFFYEQQKKTAHETVESIRKDGGQAESWEADLGDPEKIPEMFDRAEKAFGHVDILVNNAADYAADTFLPDSILKDEKSLWEGGPLKSTITVESHDRQFAVNTRAAALAMAEFARRIITKNCAWGRIINISADCAWGCPGEISYRASKYALESYSRSAAAELGPFGITVNIVSPGPVQTGYISSVMEESLIPEIPSGRVGKSEDIANAVLFFASEEAGWITGQLLVVHGGHRMALGV